MDPYHQVMLNLVKSALNEDVGAGDLTSLACVEPNRARAKIIAKSDGILSGMEPVLVVFHTVDSANQVTFLKHDGDTLAAGDIVAEIDGFNQTILTSERVALNFLGHLSGLATLTRKFVDQIAGTGCQVLDTRKTTPGWRLLEKAAVKHGGGVNHRMGLYDMILIKDNHIASAGSVTQAVAAAREYLSSPDLGLQFDVDPDKLPIEVEVTDENQLREAIACGVDRLLLDNQTIESLCHLVAVARKLGPDIKLEASGNVTLDNVAAIARTGVDFVSVGAITHSAPVTDFSLQFTAES
jgi:nicotinate-nucleotide pyrophosphorylase (carboxylating)